MNMTDGDALRLEFLRPTRITSAVPFLLPVVVTNITRLPIDGNLAGTIRIGAGIIFQPLQKAEIHFGQLGPGQKVVLTWILLAERKGSHRVTVQILSQDKILAKKTIQLVVVL